MSAGGIEPASIVGFVHGTTVVINTITQRHGARVALVTTGGFRDILVIGRGNRPDMYNLTYRKPSPFIPRHLSFEVTERTTHDGRILKEPSTLDLERVATQLRTEQVDAVAICFLHGWANPTNEMKAEALLRELLPQTTVVSSYSTSRQWREFERASSTVLSAYVAPAVRSYLSSLESSLRSLGSSGPIPAMRSNGGVSSFASAAGQPISLLESGPAAGVAAAAALGRRLGARHILTLDIGGTTAKTSAVRDGNVRIKPLHHIEASPRSAGYPVQGAIVDIVEIGAGGGSIATLDTAGGLHVGPASAGSVPGPACDGRGGLLPTVTDANLAAGRVDPAFFLGGEMGLDTREAEAALARLGSRLGIDARQAARGVLRVGVALMANALRLVTLQRGHDPRDFTFVAFGGAGPLHATLLARELGIKQAIVPPCPGHFSAYGMLEGERKADAIHTHVSSLASFALLPALAEAEQEAREELGEPGSPSTVQRSLDLRYAGQEHTIEVPVPVGVIDNGTIAALKAAFDLRSMEEFGFSLDTPVEVVAVRASARLPADELPPPASAGCGCGGREPEPRAVDFDVHGGLRVVDVRDRCSLSPGESVNGPCVIEETAATTLVLPGQVVRCDHFWNLRVEESA